MRLSIAEGYYLIALDDEEGRVLAAAERKVIPGVVAAGVLELFIQKKIAFNEGVVSVSNTAGTGNGILDNILKRVVEGESLADTITGIVAKYKDILEDLNSLLAQRGILKKEETKLLWIPLSERMDNANYAFEKDIRNHLKAIVFKKSKVTPAFATLYTLIDASDILDEVFKDRDDFVAAQNVGKTIIETADLPLELSDALKAAKTYIADVG